MFGWICGILLKIWGFTVEGKIPNDVAKKLFVVAPHTSNFDFVVGIMVRAAYRVETNYLAKHTLFRFPFGIFFRWSGGIPVDRTVKNDIVAERVKAYNENERMAIGLAPEGTRSKVERFRTGFYHIAHGSNVPLCLVKFDWKNKKVIFGDTYYLSDDKRLEIEKVESYFEGVEGYHRDKSFRVEST